MTLDTKKEVTFRGFPNPMCISLINPSKPTNRSPGAFEILAEFFHCLSLAVIQPGAVAAMGVTGGA